MNNIGWILVNSISKKRNNKPLVREGEKTYIGDRKTHSPPGQNLFAPAVFERDQMMEDTL